MRNPLSFCGALLLCASGAVVLGANSGVAGEAPGLQIQPSQGTTSWSILYEGKKVLVYEFGPQKFKPYVQQLCTIKGDNVLRDAPHDHLHHHALMYGIRVNGINFWEEVSGSGVQKVVETARPVLGFAPVNGENLPQARISQVLHWVAPQDAFLPNAAPVALLVERRSLVLTVNPRQQEVALEWTSQFEVGPKTNSVTLSGANYHGLGMRFLQELDPLAVHSLAGRRPELADNRQDVSAAPWACVSFDAPGHPATIALTGHPANTRGDPVFFSMRTPFAYLSATQNLDKEPLIYRAGEKFQLRYLVLLYLEAGPSDRLRQRVESWRQAKR